MFLYNILFFIKDKNLRGFKKKMNLFTLNKLQHKNFNFSYFEMSEMYQDLKENANVQLSIQELTKRNQELTERNQELTEKNIDERNQCDLLFKSNHYLFEQCQKLFKQIRDLNGDVQKLINDNALIKKNNDLRIQCTQLFDRNQSLVDLNQSLVNRIQELEKSLI